MTVAIPKTEYRRYWSAITIEPMIACYMCAFTLITLTVSNLNLQKACKVNLRLGNETCMALETKTKDEYAGDEIEVQKLVASMMMWQTCAQNLLPCLLVLMVGAWSDRTRKRLPFMMLPLYGELVRNLGQMLCVYYFYQLPMEVAGIVETIPIALTGGQTMMTMTAYSYIGDATSTKHRTLRVGGVNVVMALSMAIGTSLSGIVYNRLGFYGAYGISTLLLVIGLVYGLLFIKDVTPPVTADLDIKKSFRTQVSEFFNMKHIYQSLNTTFKERPNDQRRRIIILLIILVTCSGITNGFRTVGYLYTRVRFNWNEVKYSIFSTYELSMHIIGLLFAIFVFGKQLKLSEEIIGMLSTINQAVAALFYVFAYNEFLFYLGPLVNILASTENISIKSLMTKSVPNTEISQIAAIYGIAEIISAMFFGLLYNGVYEATLNIFPAAFYIITFVFNVPSTALFLWLYLKRKHKFEYSNDVYQSDIRRLETKNIDHPSTYNYGTILKS